MCGRSSLAKTEKELEKRFNATFYSDELERYNPIPNYNISPTNYCPIIIDENPDHFRVFRWGLLPFWAKSEKEASRMINMRIETIQEKSIFRKMLSAHRCLVPLDGFYEWQKKGKSKIPYRIMPQDQSIFAVAGLWSVWEKDNKKYETFTLITTPSNSFMEQIHGRMPAILNPENESYWLDPALSTDDLFGLLKPYPSENMGMYRVSDLVNNVRNNGPELIEAYKPESLTNKETSAKEGPRQLTLFD
jgi:putative SOS response-associated peptidase YedK